MATLLLTAVGTYVGGPIGGSIGSIAGQQIDQAIFGGGGRREGPRLKDLSVTSSSYGQPLGRHFGSMRVAGTVIWATDLIEHSETSGGKGKPKTTSYAYSSSFAVALGSRPIDGIGRIWADGKLLRGEAGDLKTSGSIRIYRGFGDQPADPVIASAKEGDTPAFRDCPYVVFDDLDLADFGNRIPALTFEVHADSDKPLSMQAVAPEAAIVPGAMQLEYLRGFTDDSGDLKATLANLAQAYPLLLSVDEETVRIGRAELNPAAQIKQLPPPIVTQENGRESAGLAEEHTRTQAIEVRPQAIRYYDCGRDYQPSIQRPLGTSVSHYGEVIDFPATLDADGARSLCNRRAQRERWRTERLTWSVAELDPSLRPGALVQVPSMAGTWIVLGWEWLDRGIELELERLPPTENLQAGGDPGTIDPPVDLPAMPSRIRAFELPWNGSGSSRVPSLFAAATSGSAHHRGVSLYVERGGALLPLGAQTAARSTLGQITTPLSGSTSLYFESSSALEVELSSGAQGFISVDTTATSMGANRLLVGGEILQFASAEQLGPELWRLSGLLRGRAGTEHFASEGHPAGTAAVLLDDSLTALDPDLLPSPSDAKIAGIGFGDDEPAYATVEWAGRSRAPLSPVHARREIRPNGEWRFAWTRRARGQWQWTDLVETPLVEENEQFELGVGPVSAPVARWRTNSPELVLSQADAAAILDEVPSEPVWVRQIGTFGISPATLFTTLV